MREIRSLQPLSGPFGHEDRERGEMGQARGFVRSGRHRLENLGQVCDQRAGRLRAEVEPKSGGLEEPRQRLRAAERKGSLVARDRLGPVASRPQPELQGAELGDAVLDVVERDARRGAAAAARRRSRAASRPSQSRRCPKRRRGRATRRSARRGCARGGCRASAGRRRSSRPKAASRRCPRGARGGLDRPPSGVELVEVRIGEQLHAHRRDLGELDRACRGSRPAARAPRAANGTRGRPRGSSWRRRDGALRRS